MAIAQLVPLAPPQVLTYEQYLAEGVVKQKYDIIDGVRLVTNPTRRHQRILRNFIQPFEDYERASHAGVTVIAPCDVLISRYPLRTRQPDILFLSNERLTQNPPENDPAPVSPAPELVIEIVSPSDTTTVLADKMADYQSVNVREAWVVRPVEQTVEVLSLTPTMVISVARYYAGQSVQSVTFPGLVVLVDEIYAE